MNKKEKKRNNFFIIFQESTKYKGGIHFQQYFVLSIEMLSVFIKVILQIFGATSSY